MSADLLREAAALMRERAEAVPEQAPVKADVMGVWLNSRYYLTTTPAVALAVADWLEGVAAWDDEGLGWIEPLNQTNWPSMWGDMQVSALTVARAYLGRDA